MGTKEFRRTAAKTLTPQSILALRPGQKRADGHSAPGSGRLIVRARRKGKNIVREFYFRYWDTSGAERSMLLGVYDAMSLKEARRLAQEKQDLVGSGVDPRVKRELTEQANREATERARMEQRKGTLEDLLTEYIGHLRASGKVSAADVEGTLKLHVINAFPGLASKRARDITAEDVTDILARMISKGIGRRTNLVRAFLRAAFAFGSKRDNDPVRKARALKGGDGDPVKLFGISANPVADVKRIAEYDRALDRVLSDEELKHYWNSLGDLHPGIGNTLRVALLLGGQRLSQLKRATWSDYAAKDRVLALRDTKGRGGKRDHLLPVSDRVAAILATLKSLNPAGYIFSTTSGEKQIDLSTLSNAVTDIARTYWKNNKDKAYSAADIRRSVETRLAAMKVSKEIRAQLLSHGRASGVQEKHYDRHDYLPEKASALSKWEAHVFRVVKGESGKVVVGRFRSRAA